MDTHSRILAGLVLGLAVAAIPASSAVNKLREYKNTSKQIEEKTGPHPSTFT